MICITILILSLPIVVDTFFDNIGYRESNPADYSQSTIQKFDDLQNYQEFALKSMNGAIIPGIMEGIIPQGICFIAEKDIILITGYHKGGASSVIFMVDRDDQKLVKSVLLVNEAGMPFDGHVGGIASDGGNVWIASERSVYTFTYEELEMVPNMGTVKIVEEIRCSVKADYICYTDSYLLVGEYNYAPFYRTDSSHTVSTDTGEKYSALVVGYSLNEEGTIIESAEFAVGVPDKVQGIAIRNDGSIIVSSSFWCFEDSTLMCYSGVEAGNTSIILAGKEVPIYYLNDQCLLWKLCMPSMSEGIALVDDNCYILFENAALLYSWYSKNQICNVKILNMKELNSKFT